MSGPIRPFGKATAKSHPSCPKLSYTFWDSDLLGVRVCVNGCGSVIASNLSKLRVEYDSAITNLISVDEQFVLTNGQVRSKSQIPVYYIIYS